MRLVRSQIYWPSFPVWQVCWELAPGWPRGCHRRNGAEWQDQKQVRWRAQFFLPRTSRRERATTAFARCIAAHAGKLASCRDPAGRARKQAREAVRKMGLQQKKERGLHRCDTVEMG